MSNPGVFGDRKKKDRVLRPMDIRPWLSIQMAGSENCGNSEYEISLPDLSA